MHSSHFIRDTRSKTLSGFGTQRQQYKSRVTVEDALFLMEMDNRRVLYFTARGWLWNPESMRQRPASWSTCNRSSQCEIFAFALDAIWNQHFACLNEHPASDFAPIWQLQSRNNRRIVFCNQPLGHVSWWNQAGSFSIKLTKSIRHQKAIKCQAIFVI